MFSRGMILAQHKEPALSQKLITFLNPRTQGNLLSSKPVPSTEMPDPDVLIQIAREAEIYDDYNARPLYESLLECREGAVAIVVDAVDDEPYVSSKTAPLLQLQAQVVAGIQICEHICATSNVMILVYGHLTGIESHIPFRIGSYPVVRVRGGYPAKPSAAQVRKLGSGKKLFISAGAAIFLHRAVRLAMKQHACFITVAGNCVSNPSNMEVSLGMPVAQILERVGLHDEPTHIVCGGPMRGIAVTNAEKTIIVPTTRAILAFKRSKNQNFAACIGCARCEQSCPAGLNPAYVHKHVKRGYYQGLRHFDPHLCQDCGTCSYICPSRQETAVSMAKARAFAQRQKTAAKL